MQTEHPWEVGLVPGPANRTLDAWSVYEVSSTGPQGPWTAHLTGFSREGCNGRVSTAIVRFDLPARRVLTASGRVYELAGRPGMNGDAFAVWGRWIERDVTELVDLELVSAGAAPGE